MGIRIEQAFTVKAPAEEVWAYLMDPRRVAGALPGAEIIEEVDGRTFKGKITVKVGPVSAKFGGLVRFEEIDEEARTATLVASGRGLRGVGNAEMRMQGRVSDAGGGETAVKMSSEVTITGLLAQFGRGMIDEVSQQMMKRFAEALRADLEGRD
ncbi:MAG: SRPBCC family protein [Acidobacteriota bacterium]